MTRRCPRRRVGHRHGNQPYYFENSLRGLLWFLKLLFPWVDFDCHVTADGILVVTHWPKPLRHGFYDPLGLIHIDATIEELTWAEVKRLRSRDGKGYRISRADVLVPKALRRGMKVELEMKTSAITEGQLRALKRECFDGTVGTYNPKHLQVKGFPKFLPALLAAHRAGYTTIALTHPGQRHLPASARPCIDYFRGMTPIWDQSR